MATKIIDEDGGEWYIPTHTMVNVKRIVRQSPKTADILVFNLIRADVCPTIGFEVAETLVESERISLAEEGT